MTRSLVPEDLLRFAIPEEVEISRDGRELYYVHQTINADQNAYRRIIRAIDRETKEARDLTHGPNDRSPRIAPDGRHLAFLRPEDDIQQIWVLPFAGGEPQRLTDWSRDVGSPVWFPNSRHLIVEVELDKETLPPSRSEAKRRDDAASPEEKFTQDVRYITRAFYRLDTVGYLHSDRYRHLVKISLDPAEPPEILTRGPYHHSQAAIHPDGTLLAYQSNRQDDPDRHPYDDIYVLNSATGEEQPVTDGHGSYGSPQFSPDGRWLYFFGHDYAHGFYTQTKLYRAALADGKAGRPQLVWDPDDGDFGAEGLDDMHAHGPSRLALGFSPDETRLYAMFSIRGSVQIAEWDIAQRTRRLMTQGERVIYGFSQDYGRSRWALLQADADAPGDVYSAEWDGQHLNLRRSTELNHDVLTEVSLFRPQHFTFQTEPLGEPIDGWFLVPPGPGPHPLALEIHGGPMAMYAPTFFFEFQMLVGAGIGVVFTNPHGSRGYGEAFCASIKGAWGGQDFRDIMGGLDQALKTKLFDPERLAVLGGSYGGFMTNWAIGHTDRFKAAVTMRSVVDEFSYFGTADLGYMDDWEWGTVPWQNPDRYLDASPLMSVAKMHTPLLIVHSEEDWRCPISQAEELFAALKWLGREVAFARFPGESHELSRSGKPWHRVKRLALIRQWMVDHLMA